jgi:hypothetical protein
MAMGAARESGGLLIDRSRSHDADTHAIARLDSPTTARLITLPWPTMTPTPPVSSFCSHDISYLRPRVVDLTRVIMEKGENTRISPSGSTPIKAHTVETTWNLM